MNLFISYIFRKFLGERQETSRKKNSEKIKKKKKETEEDAEPAITDPHLTECDREKEIPAKKKNKIYNNYKTQSAYAYSISI